MKKELKWCSREGQDNVWLFLIYIYYLFSGRANERLRPKPLSSRRQSDALAPPDGGFSPEPACGPFWKRQLHPKSFFSHASEVSGRIKAEGVEGFTVFVLSHKRNLEVASGVMKFSSTERSVMHVSRRLGQMKEKNDEGNTLQSFQKAIPHIHRRTVITNLSLSICRCLRSLIHH